MWTKEMYRKITSCRYWHWIIQRIINDGRKSAVCKTLHNASFSAIIWHQNEASWSTLASTIKCVDWIKEIHNSRCPIKRIFLSNLMNQIKVVKKLYCEILLIGRAAFFLQLLVWYNFFGINSLSTRKMSLAAACIVSSASADCLEVEKLKQDPQIITESKTLRELRVSIFQQMNSYKVDRHILQKLAIISKVYMEKVYLSIRPLCKGMPSSDMHPHMYEAVKLIQMYFNNFVSVVRNEYHW